MIPVPTLAEVIQDQRKLAELPFTAMWSLLSELHFLEREIMTTMIALDWVKKAASAEPADHLLTTEEAAARCNVSPQTMKRWAHRLPYSTAVVVLSRTVVRWNAQRLDDVLRTLGARPRRKAAV